ncbi:MAG TPA: iron-sulfur cluster repair di-iron protein [Thermoanaerobaculia bacterium]|nr:iron-sulfur cluster repair di-iron protein [Thermoanaerobaculia bacterium]
MKSVGEIAAENPAAIPIFERLQIDYCCGGKTPLSDACATAGITTDEFFATLNASPAAPEHGLDWSGRTLTELQNYLVERFHAHAREELDALNLLAAKVLGVHGSRRPELSRVAQLVKALTDDMLPHMMKEEIVLFPYVASVESGEPKACCFGSVENPVRMMMMEHEAVGELLAALRTTTSDFAPPEDACFSYRELYRRLGAFETETHEHIHLENNVHFPRAIEIERAVLV